jgi:hypothetical protein
MRLAGVIAMLLAGGCSFVLDTDELVADGLPSSSDSGDTGEADALDDVPPDKTIIVRHSGVGGRDCTLDYRVEVTQCATPCAEWTYVVDASASTGVGSFAWSFSATDEYTVEPRSAAGPRVELRIGAPECLIGGQDMPNFDLLVRLSTDGGDSQIIPLPKILVSKVQTCSGEGGCPDPP